MSIPRLSDRSMSMNEDDVGIGAMQPTPQKMYTLRNGQQGTQYEFILDEIKRLEALKLAIEEHLEIRRNQLDLAEGHP